MLDGMGQLGHNLAQPLFSTLQSRVGGCEAVSLVSVGILCLRAGGEFYPVFADSASDCSSERINNSALILYFTFYFYVLCVIEHLSAMEYSVCPKKYDFLWDNWV